MDFHQYLCLIPPAIVIVLAMWMRRSFEALLVGCLVGYALINWSEFPGNFIKSLMMTLQSETMVWVILVCGLYGGLIHLMIESGGVFAFGNYMLRFVKSRRSALFATWLVGLLIFLDDYMSALATGVSMRKITDHYRISREFLAYLVNTMAAPICVLIPMTTWSIYCGNEMQKNDIIPAGSGFWGFLWTIPYMFYGWFAVIVALGVALGIIPLVGKLKRAEERVANGGSVYPDAKEIADDNIALPDTSKATPILFFLPIFVLIAATFFFDKDALKGAMAGVIFTLFFYWGMGVSSYSKLCDGIFEGFKSMVFALAILTMSYVLKTVGDEMGLTQFVIESVKNILNKELLAAVVFVFLGLISYSTSSSWGLYVVALPIVIPLANAYNANVWMVCAAVFSAGAFGSNASFYSDVTVLTSSSTECNNMEHSFSQLPYAALSALLATVAFLVCGYMGW